MPKPVVLNLNDEKAVRSFFMSKVHSAWRYGGFRSKENTIALLSVPFDFDNGDMSFNEAVDRFKGYAGVVHTSTGHTKEHPKLRVILVLAEPITDKAAFKPICDWLKKEYPDADKQVFKISQPLFPCCKYDDGKATTGFPLFRLKVLTGKPFTFPPEVLKTVPPTVDGGNKSDWPELDPRLSKYRSDLYRKSLDLLLAKGVRKGGRDNRAIIIASECRKCGIDIGETGRLLSEWNGLNNPPLTLDDLERIVRSAYAGEGYDFGESDGAVKKAREKARADIRKNGLQDTDDVNDNDGEKEDRKPPPSLTDLMRDSSLTERPKTVGRWVSWKQRITLLVGSAKRSGKSTLCTYESLVVLDGGGKVLWVSNDEPLGDVVRRFKEANVPNDAADRVYVLHSEISNVMPRTWKGLYDVIVAVGPDIIVLDSIHTLFPLFSESHAVPEAHETALWQAETSRLRSAALAADAAVVWIHHENKSGTSAGSVGIEAAVDVIAHLRHVGGNKSPNTRTLSFLGRFIGPSSDKTLQYINEVDGYREIDLKDNGKKTDRRDVAMESWILEQFDGVEERTSADMNARIKAKYGKSKKVSGRVRYVAIENLGITVGNSDGAFPAKKVWRTATGADPRQFTEEGES